jgi:hypothetical protein
MEWAAYALAWAFLAIFGTLLFGAFIAAGKGNDNRSNNLPQRNEIP